MQNLAGHEVLGRPVKLGPGVARSKKKISQGGSRRRSNDDNPVLKRWTETDAPIHFQGYSEQGRRVWVGGLPRMTTHAEVNRGVRELFKGFQM